MKLLITSLCLAVLPLSALVTAAQTEAKPQQEATKPQETEAAPATILRMPYLSSTSRGFTRYSELHIDIQNPSAKPIKSVEIQFDIIDTLRRVAKDRLFIEVEDIGFGDRSIKPGKTRSFNVDVDYVLPRGAGDGYGTYYCERCAVINVVHFKDGTKWERKGWRDEPNPNR